MNHSISLVVSVFTAGVLGFLPNAFAHEHRHAHAAACSPSHQTGAACCSGHLKPVASPTARFSSVDWENSNTSSQWIQNTPPFIETDQTGIKLNGYVDAGYLYNFTPTGSRVRNRYFKTDSMPKGDFNFHSVNLLLYKLLPAENWFVGGFVLELSLGEDSAHEHIGHEEHDHDHDEDGIFSDQFHMHQAYALFRLPVGNGVDFSIGKFHSPIGYEGCPARPYQLHITRSHVTRAEPGHLMGAMAIYPLSPHWSLGTAVSNTQESDNAMGIDNMDDAYSWTSYINYQPTDNFMLRGGFYLSPWGDESFGMEENEPAYIFNAYTQWRPLFADQRLLLVLNATMAQFDDYSADNGSSFYGVAGYVRYQFNDLFSLGSRIEYVHTDDDQLLRLGDGTIDGHHVGKIDAKSNDILGITTTAQFDLAEDTMLRFEYRFDSGNDIVNTTSQEHMSTFSSKDHAHTLAMQVVYQF